MLSLNFGTLTNLLGKSFKNMHLALAKSLNGMGKFLLQ